MPQGNNPADDKRTAENRIEDKAPAAQGANGNAESNDTVKRAYQDVQNLREQIERLKAQAQKIYETPSEPADQEANPNAESDGPVSDAVKPAAKTPAVDPEAARAAEEGIRVLIANGKREGIVKDLYNDVPGTVCTEFVPAPGGVSSVKKWIAHSSGFAKGTVTVNAAARKALCGETAVSLLPVGVTSVQGDFEEGDIIGILDPSGELFAVGKSAYSSAQAREVLGQHDCRPLVHYDYLSLL